jgi:hypothetical protein
MDTAQPGSDTPFALTAAGYLLAGAEFGVLVPGVTHVAMRDVPAGTSGAASGVVNASCQVGTFVGLAVLGSLGVTAAISDWHATIARLPAFARRAAAQQAQNVAGAHISAVTQAIGPAYRGAAAQAFVHGYHLAAGIGAICVLGAATTALLGFRQPRPQPWTRQLARPRPRRPARTSGIAPAQPEIAPRRPRIPADDH